VSKLIGHATTTLLIKLVLATYPEMKWDGIYIYIHLDPYYQSFH